MKKYSVILLFVISIILSSKLAESKPAVAGACKINFSLMNLFSKSPKEKIGFFKGCLKKNLPRLKALTTKKDLLNAGGFTLSNTAFVVGLGAFRKDGITDGDLKIDASMNLPLMGAVSVISTSQLTGCWKILSQAGIFLIFPRLISGMWGRTPYEGGWKVLIASPKTWGMNILKNAHGTFSKKFLITYILAELVTAGGKTYLNQGFYDSNPENRFEWANNLFYDIDTKKTPNLEHYVQPEYIAHQSRTEKEQVIFNYILDQNGRPKSIEDMREHYKKETEGQKSNSNIIILEEYRKILEQNKMDSTQISNNIQKNFDFFVVNIESDSTPSH